MNRTVVASILILVAGSFVVLGVSKVPGKAPNVIQEVKPPEGRNVEAKLIQLLNRRLDQDEFDGPLKEVLSYLSDRYQVPIIINDDAFRRGLNVTQTENLRVKIPRMSGVPFGTLLVLMLDQVGGAYLVRPNYFEITTCARALDEVKRPKTSPASECPADIEAASLANQEALRKLDLVHAEFERKPFQEAIKDVQGSGFLNILVDPQAKEQAAKPVSALLANVPAETAVRLLAGMAGLRTVAMDNVYYITTPENADKIEKAQSQVRAKLGVMKPAGP